jgi:hypothetical protein
MDRPSLARKHSNQLRICGMRSTHCPPWPQPPPPPPPRRQMVVLPSRDLSLLRPHRRSSHRRPSLGLQAMMLTRLSTAEMYGFETTCSVMYKASGLLIHRQLRYAFPSTTSTTTVQPVPDPRRLRQGIVLFDAMGQFLSPGVSIF